MKTYHVTKQTSISNRVVKELNAAVLMLTFKSTGGIQFAELWADRHSSDALVGVGSCPPVGSTFVDVVRIDFAPFQISDVVGITKVEIAAQLDKYSPLHNFSAQTGLSSYNNYTRAQLLDICLELGVNPVSEYHQRRAA